MSFRSSLLKPPRWGSFSFVVARFRGSFQDFCVLVCGPVGGVSCMGPRRDRQPTSAAVVDKQVLGVFVVCGPVAWNLDGGPFECKLAVHTLQKQTAK